MKSSQIDRKKWLSEPAHENFEKGKSTHQDPLPYLPNWSVIRTKTILNWVVNLYYFLLFIL